MISPILAKVIWLFAGALIPIYLAKLTIIELDNRTNTVMPTLIFVFIVSIALFAKLLGY